ncbi:MAG: hypothetical protein JNM56_30640, partial [Planctomycetia bacterium]|nr:hypothetical protein [Planctomycetia bacterium]
MAVITRLPCQRPRHTAMTAAALPWPFSGARAFQPARHGSAVPVRGLAREIVVEIAGCRHHWDAAFRLVQQNYEAHGYAMPGSGTYRFTAQHALPTTAVLVAREGDRILATMSLYLDSALGLPSDSIYSAELDQLRRGGRRLAEGGSLADGGLRQREFMPVFVALNRLAWQYGISQGVDTVVISTQPKHGIFYRRTMGYMPLGAPRRYSFVEGAMAQAYWLDVPHLQTKVPTVHEQLLGVPLPKEALTPRPMP